MIVAQEPELLVFHREGAGSGEATSTAHTGGGGWRRRDGAC